MDIEKPAIEKNGQQLESQKTPEKPSVETGEINRRQSMYEDSEENEITLEKIKINTLENLLAVAEKLIYRLREREEERLMPIIDESEVSRLITGFRDLNEGIRTKKFEQLEYGLKNIESAIDSIGHVGRSGSNREDEESLGRVAFYLKELGEPINNLRTEVAKNIPLNSKLQRILDNLENKWLFVRKRAELVRSY